MPLARMELYKGNVQIYLAPTADARDTWIASMRHIACEGRCYVLSANQFMKGKHYPKFYQKQLKKVSDADCSGGSLVVNPMGEVIAGPIRDREGLITISLDLKKTLDAKFDFDVVGHYRFPQ